MTQIVRRIQEQGVAYFKAVHSSVDVAGRGYTFCASADHFCAVLDKSGPDGPTKEDVIQTIRDFKALANNVYIEAKKTTKEFSSVRTKLYGVRIRPCNMAVQRVERP